MYSTHMRACTHTYTLTHSERKLLSCKVKMYSASVSVLHVITVVLLSLEPSRLLLSLSLLHCFYAAFL